MTWAIIFALVLVVILQALSAMTKRDEMKTASFWLMNSTLYEDAMNAVKEALVTNSRPAIDISTQTKAYEVLLCALYHLGVFKNSSLLKALETVHKENAAGTGCRLVLIPNVDGIPDYRLLEQKV